MRTSPIVSSAQGAWAGLLAAAALALSAPAAAQVEPVDPGGADAAAPGYQEEGLVWPDDANSPEAGTIPALPAEAPPGETPPAAATTAPQTPPTGSTTYKEDDLIGAAEGVFGKGAEGLARIIQDLLKKQGEPNGYIVGREAGGAFVFGLRYGSGTLYHKVEGQRTVYWTGPSVGFDAGANAGSTFVLVYNLHDSEELYKRFPAGEGQAYFVGGFNASYLRQGDVVLIPIRLGVGLRFGINAGYMKFTRNQKWMPF